MWEGKHISWREGSWVFKIPPRSSSCVCSWLERIKGETNISLSSITLALINHGLAHPSLVPIRWIAWPPAHRKVNWASVLRILWLWVGLIPKWTGVTHRVILMGSYILKAQEVICLSKLEWIFFGIFEKAAHSIFCQGHDHCCSWRAFRTNLWPQGEWLYTWHSPGSCNEVSGQCFRSWICKTHEDQIRPKRTGHSIARPLSVRIFTWTRLWSFSHSLFTPTVDWSNSITATKVMGRRFSSCYR